MLKNALSQFLDSIESDDQVLHLFRSVNELRNNGVQFRHAIKRACELPLDSHIKISMSLLHADNVPAFLAIRHRKKLLEFHRLGYGYGKIATMLASRNVFNKNTRKAYSRNTIKRALELLEKGKK
jgi:hypothetical protein